MNLLMDYDLLSDLQGVLYRVFRAAFAIRGNEGMKNIAVFGDQSVTGIECLSKLMAW
jgi:hypothetical protein